MRPTGQLTFFRLATTDDQQGKAAADYFFQTKHYSKVLLLKDDNDLYSFGLAQAFQQEWQHMGGSVLPLDFSQSASGVQDYQNALQGAISFQPDLIYFAGNTPNGSYVLQALSTIETLKTVPFAGGNDIMSTLLLQMAASLHWEAPIYVTLPIQDPVHVGTAMGTNFEADYRANGYNDYRPYAAAAYDCTMILIQAIKTALQKKGVSTPHGAQDHAGAVKFRQAVLQELRHLPPYKGATGTHSFDANGDTTNHAISFYRANLSPQPTTPNLSTPQPTAPNLSTPQPTTPQPTISYTGARRFDANANAINRILSFYQANLSTPQPTTPQSTTPQPSWIWIQQINT
jgi:branched-chain amino acid transport system substrate-binding protein